MVCDRLCLCYPIAKMAANSRILWIGGVRGVKGMPPMMQKRISRGRRTIGKDSSSADVSLGTFSCGELGSWMMQCMMVVDKLCGRVILQFSFGVGLDFSRQSRILLFVTPTTFDNWMRVNSEHRR